MDNSNLSLLGFNSYESKVIDVLLGGVVLSVKDIYSKTRIPKNKIYETLEILKVKGVIGEEAVKPKRYFIINDSLLDKMVEEREKGLEELKLRFEEMKKAKEKVNPAVLSIIDGDDEVHRLIEYSNMTVKHTIRSCSRLTRMYYNCYRSLKTAIERGVAVKFVAIYNGRNYDILKSYHDIGVDIRLWDPKRGVFPKIGLFDDTLTRITIWNPDVKNPKQYKTIWANSTILYEIVKNHFETIWNSCDSFESLFSKGSKAKHSAGSSDIRPS